MNCILYNVTVKIVHASHDRWLAYMENEHIPDVMKTGMFHSYRLSRLLGVNEDEGITYSIQYLLTSWEMVETYQKEFAPDLQAEHLEKFKDEFVAFRTVMRVVSGSDLPE